MTGYGPSATSAQRWEMPAPEGIADLLSPASDSRS